MERVGGHNDDSDRTGADQADSSGRKSGSEEQGRLGRIADETRGLVDDVKEWVDLRIQLLQYEVEDRIEGVANKIVATFLFATLATLTFLFFLLAAAFGLGDWLGRPVWGFLIVAFLLLGVSMILNRSRPRLIRRKKEDQAEPAKKDETSNAGKRLEKGTTTQGQIPAGPPTAPKSSKRSSIGTEPSAGGERNG